MKKNDNMSRPSALAKKLTPLKNSRFLKKIKNRLTMEDKEQTQNQETVQDQENTQNQEQQESPKKDKKEKKNCKKSADETKIQELGEKLNELNDKYLRTYSEYENYRKRTAKEKNDLLIYGAQETIKAILPIVDDFERALLATTDESAKEGMQLIYNKLMNTLQQKGLKAIEAKGEKFNEDLHEAITQFPATDEAQKGTVVDVVEKGYFLNDKVIRYAKVVVAI